jgi:hypothetical protein
MSRIRDIANILSANTDIATDAEVASSVSAAVSTHATAANGHVGRGTTENRPVSPTLGDLYFDTTLNALIAYRSEGWEKVSQDPAPQVDSISPTTAAITGTTITITGSNFQSGLSVQFIGTNLTAYNSPIATFVNGTTATATTPNLPVAYEPYDVKVVNNDNQFGILDNCLDSGGTPVWNTASGTLSTIIEKTALSASVSATDPDGTLIVYSSSNLPSWISLNPSTGSLTGTSPEISVDTNYSFDITASDGVNTSSRSFAVSSTATVVPGAPTIGTATGGDSSATLTFTAGSTGGATVSNYKYSSDNSTYTAFSPAQTTSPLTISGLTNGQSYSFYLKAVNENGDSAASAASNTITANIPSDYEAIATYNADGTTGSVIFNSNGVWANYKHLQLRWIAKTTRSAPNDSIVVQLNGDTGSNYLRQEVEWDHTNNQFYPLTGPSTGMVGGAPGVTYANYFGTGYANIYDVNSSKNKPFYITGCFAQGGTASGQNNWTIDNGSYTGSTSAITSIRVFCNANWATNTKIALYGIKG